MKRYDKPGQVLIAGHRGIMAMYPENTEISFQAAVDLGCDMIETDLRMTRNGHIVLIHDAAVERTSDGHGTVSEMTLDELEQLDFGCKCGEDPRFRGKPDRPEFRRCRIMTLPAFCRLMQPTDLLLNIEIKDNSPRLVDLTIQILQAHDLTGRCVFTSFHPAILTRCHDKYGVRTQGFLQSYIKEGFVSGENGTYSKMYAVGIGMRDVAPALAKSFTEQGIQPWAWPPDTEEEVRHCLSCGIRVLTCNDPRPALAILRGR